MKELFGKMLDHPIATILIISASANGVANIVSAAKGKGVNPVLSVKVDKPENKTT